MAPVKEKSEMLTRQDIEKKINLKVPAQYRSRYVDLLFKHRAALCVGKHDLGQARHFSHRINLKDNTPVYIKQFKIPAAHSDFIKKEIAHWLKLGVVR